MTGCRCPDFQGCNVGPKILTEFCWMSMKPSFDLSCQFFLNIFVGEHGLVFSTVAELSDPCPDLINLKDLKSVPLCPSGIRRANHSGSPTTKF